jgi:nucleotide-binding universal stress UspA family protein/RimJ/RimL family protein N-acetyltransferase
MGRVSVSRLMLRDGTPVDVRPIEPEDRDALVAAFERLSPETRYRRFFGPVNELSPRALDHLTIVDHADHEALAAFDEDGAIVGVARYVRIAEGEAEPAIVVADDWQGRGVGSRLLALLVRRAREEGVERFRAPVLARNRDAIALFKRLGDTQTVQMGRETELRIVLTPEDEGPRDLRDVLREVASGTLAPARTLLAQVLPRRTPPPDRSTLRNTIVVATDGSEPATAAVRAAAELAPALGASVQLVSVHWPLLGDREAMHETLERAAGLLRARGVEVHAHARRGDPAASVMDVAKEERARMILLGPSTGGGASQLLLGSVGATVAAHAPCDVMIVRPRPAGEP